jgi:hypothetical protein
MAITKIHFANSRSFATLAAMRRASSLLSNFAAEDFTRKVSVWASSAYPPLWDDLSITVYCAGGRIRNGGDESVPIGERSETGLRKLVCGAADVATSGGDDVACAALAIIVPWVAPAVLVPWLVAAALVVLCLIPAATLSYVRQLDSMRTRFPSHFCTFLKLILMHA